MPKADPEILLRAMQLSPEEAIEFFKSKGYEITWNWDDMAQEAHTRAFTVAKATSLDILKDIRGGLDKALEEGTTFRDFQKDLEPRLRAKGWWGVQEGVDADGNPTSVQLGSPWRLKTIFQTNMQTAYMAGRERQMQAASQDRPFWKYIAVMDSKTRQAHRELNGKIFRFDDPFWDHFYPPNGFNCRCRVVTLSPREIERDGLKVSSSKGQMVPQEVADPNTGRVFKTTSYRSPDTLRLLHPDEGFDLNPSRIQQRLEAIEREKLKETEKAVGAKLPEIRVETPVKAPLNAPETSDKIRSLVDDEEAKAEIRKAETRAKELGVEASFGEHPASLETAKLVVTGIDDDLKAGRPLPPRVIIGARPDKEWDESAMAVFDASTGKPIIYVNPDIPWRQVRELLEEKKHLVSTTSPYHFYLHETGHWRHWKNATPRQWALGKEPLPPRTAAETMGQVSVRALHSRGEYVAEVDAMLADKQKVPERVLYWYYIFGGARP